MKSLDSMTPDELFVEAGKIREQIVISAERLHKVCDLMYAQARRRPDDLTSTFVSISNAGRRFAGSVVNGAKRTEGVDRILEATKSNLRQAREREARKLETIKRAEERTLRRLQASKRNDVYGLFTSSNEEDLIEQMMSRGDNASDLNDLYGEE